MGEPREDAGQAWSGFSRAQQLAVIVLALLALAGMAAYWWVTGPGPEPLQVEESAGKALTLRESDRESATGDAGGDRPKSIVVHVAGAVRTPGIYNLPEGERVAAAVAAAGGPSPKASMDPLNLAAKLIDGQKILVPEKNLQGTLPLAVGGEAPSGGPAGTAGQSVAENPVAGPLNLNTATVQQLDGLPGIGPALAQRLIDFRESNGGFRSIEDLRKVEGIGDKRFEDLKTKCTV